MQQEVISWPVVALRGGIILEAFNLQMENTHVGIIDFGMYVLFISFFSNNSGE